CHPLLRSAQRCFQEIAAGRDSLALTPVEKHAETELELLSAKAPRWHLRRQQRSVVLLDVQLEVARERREAYPGVAERQRERDARLRVPAEISEGMLSGELRVIGQGRG